MSNKIHVNYGEIYVKAAALRARIEDELARMDAAYAEVVPMLGEVDGAAVPALSEMIEANKRKSRMQALTMQKLLTALERSAMQMEAADEAMAAVYAPAAHRRAGAKES
ncbi:MAG: hypothetical protein LBR44_01885 [Clostridiales Family XIII bacterium]|jgi:adenylyl- and sulfurtransferase ThiI|nr:hypothetical protein [Clostridiales Family XIII bacterium]